MAHGSYHSAEEAGGCRSHSRRIQSHSSLSRKLDPPELPDPDTDGPATVTLSLPVVPL